MYRRYNDFVVFHEMLLQKFPYRMVPALPPKRVLGGRAGSGGGRGARCETCVGRPGPARVGAADPLVPHWWRPVLTLGTGEGRLLWATTEGTRAFPSRFQMAGVGGGGGRGAGCRPTPCSRSAADREFIEARRRALRRFINLVARHPPFSEDVALRLFLSFSGPVSITLLWVRPESPRVSGVPKRACSPALLVWGPSGSLLPSWCQE